MSTHCSKITRVNNGQIFQVFWDMWSPIASSTMIPSSTSAQEMFWSTSKVHTLNVWCNTDHTCLCSAFYLSSHTCLQHKYILLKHESLLGQPHWKPMLLLWKCMFIGVKGISASLGCKQPLMRTLMYAPHSNWQACIKKLGKRILWIPWGARYVVDKDKDQTGTGMSEAMVYLFHGDY